MCTFLLVAVDRIYVWVSAQVAVCVHNLKETERRESRGEGRGEGESKSERGRGREERDEAGE